MARGKKYQLVDSTYELLKHYSPDEITIRQIAEAANCTSTVIYRHFDNLDHLILVSSIRFLEDYIIDLGDIVESDLNELAMLRSMWVSFARECFKNLEVFESMFWGKYRNQMTDAIFHYYSLFPDQWRNFNGIFTSVFFSNDLLQRNLIMLQRTVTSGYIEIDDVNMLNSIQCSLFHGTLIEYRDVYRDPAKAKEGTDRYMAMYDLIMDKFLKK